MSEMDTNSHSYKRKSNFKIELKLNVPHRLPGIAEKRLENVNIRGNIWKCLVAPSETIVKSDTRTYGACVDVLL